MHTPQPNRQHKETAESQGLSWSLQLLFVFYIECLLVCTAHGSCINPYARRLLIGDLGAALGSKVLLEVAVQRLLGAQPHASSCRNWFKPQAWPRLELAQRSTVTAPHWLVMLPMMQERY